MRAYLILYNSTRTTKLYNATTVVKSMYHR